MYRAVAEQGQIDTQRDRESLELRNDELGLRTSVGVISNWKWRWWNRKKWVSGWNKMDKYVILGKGEDKNNYHHVVGSCNKKEVKSKIFWTKRQRKTWIIKIIIIMVYCPVQDHYRKKYLKWHSENELKRNTYTAI